MGAPRAGRIRREKKLYREEINSKIKSNTSPRRNAPRVAYSGTCGLT
jgi:hypothetical protein